MKLTELTAAAFSQAVASDAPAPGGGSVAALTAAHGAALTAMVAGLTLGRKKYAEAAENAAAVQQRCLELQRQLLEMTDRDTEAYHAVSAAFALPKGTEEEKAARTAAIQAGLRQCTESPLRVMSLTARAVDEACALLQGGYNTSAASDLAVAFLTLRAGLLGAWCNVRINVGSLQDAAYAARARQQGQELLLCALGAAEAGYERLSHTLEA